MGSSIVHLVTASRPTQRNFMVAGRM